MPLSYCSIAWAIQPTAADNKRERGIPRKPQTDRRRGEAKSTFG
jgi:hypothetical protein